MAIAQEPSGNLAETWVIHTKAGQEAEFEQAFQTHLEVRKEKGDPRAWHTWVPITGADIGGYVVRSCCSAWKDMDGYRDWGMQAEIVVDWNQNVHQYVAVAAGQMFAAWVDNFEKTRYTIYQFRADMSLTPDE